MQHRLAWTIGILTIGTALTVLGSSLSHLRPPAPVNARLQPAGAPDSRTHVAPGPPTEGPAEITASMRVHVVGAVREPGVYVVPQRARVVDAMQRAGGPTNEADLETINLADILKDGDQVRIPKLSERAGIHPKPAASTRQAAKSGRRSGRRPFASTPQQQQTPPPLPTAVAPPERPPIDLNTATAEQLKSLPGIGQALCERIIDYRQSQGPFRKVSDLLNVPGFSMRLYISLRPYLQVEDTE